MEKSIIKDLDEQKLKHIHSNLKETLKLFKYSKLFSNS